MDEARIEDGINALKTGMIGMFILALIIILFVVIYQRKLLKQEQVLKDAEAKHQQDLLKATIESQELERKRIAHDLHDGVGVMLTSTRLFFRHLQENKVDNSGATVERIDTLLGQTIDAVREISSNLRPVVLESLGLSEALSDLVNVVSDTGEISIYFESEYDLNRQESEEVMIYRIVQELLTNTLRHAEASNVQLSMKSVEEGFFLSYSDDGKGLPEYPLKGGLGLKNLESRVKAMDGFFQIDTTVVKGMRITISIRNDKD